MLTHAARGDYAIAECEHGAAVALVRAHHYAGGAANTSVLSVAAYRGGRSASDARARMVAAALWLPPTRACAESVSPDWQRVLSLSRLVVVPGEPTNVASMVIGACIRILRRDGAWSHLVTYADESQGHTGTIYRATNWTYVGRTRPEARWVDAAGRQVSRKCGPRSRTAAEMSALGYVMAGRFAKHKFVMALPPARPKREAQQHLFKAVS